MLTEPIVEGAYYEREDGRIWGPVPECLAGTYKARLTRRVYLVPTDPAEVVAELRERKEAADMASDPDGSAMNYERYDGRAEAFDQAADLVAEKLGVKP